MHEDAVARLDCICRHPLPRHGGFEIGDRDLLAEIEIAALERREIEQVSGRDNRLDVLNAELLEAVGVAHLDLCEAVVESHLVLVLALKCHADVAEAIELRSDLADLTRDELIMVNEVVRSERAAGRPAWDTQREAPLAEHRHARFIEMAHLVELAGFNQSQCVQYFFRRYQICGADLIVLTPFGRPPQRDRGRSWRCRLSLRGSDNA